MGHVDANKHIEDDLVRNYDMVKTINWNHVAVKELRLLTLGTPPLCSGPCSGLASGHVDVNQHVECDLVRNYGRVVLICLDHVEYKNKGYLQLELLCRHCWAALMSRSWWTLGVMQLGNKFHELNEKGYFTWIDWFYLWPMWDSCLHSQGHAHLGLLT